MPRIDLAAFLAAMMPLSVAAGWPDDHLALADAIVDEILPENNDYGAPSAIWVEDGEWRVYAVCGGFINVLLQLSYAPLSDTLMSALFDDDPDDGPPWSSPDSTHWYRALLAERAVTTEVGVYRLVRRRTAAELRAGDVLVAEYSEGGITGHTMLIRQVRGEPTRVAAKIPGFAELDRHSLQIVDSSASVHMAKEGTTDTRYQADIDPATGEVVDDRGAGMGDIFVFSDPDTGALVGWTWGWNQTTPYQGVDPTPGPGVGKYRPIAAGRLVGPGL